MVWPSRCWNRREVILPGCLPRSYGLVIHDWSDLLYGRHMSKKDRKKIGSDWGYKLATSLLISDLTGAPIVPVSLGLWANDGWHTTRDEKVRNESLAIGIGQ